MSSVPAYYAGIIDAQLTVGLRANNTARVSLSYNDSRVAEELTAKFPPTSVTLTKRPNKKDVCTALFAKDNAKALLEFAAEHCVLKKPLAEKALLFLDDKATAEEVKDTADLEVEDVTLDWASGFIDVRGSVLVDEDAPKKSSVRVVVPKSEKFILPVLQKVINGKIKKASPCRLVFENQATIKALIELVGDRVRAKKSDLDVVGHLATPAASVSVSTATEAATEPAPAPEAEPVAVAA